MGRIFLERRDMGGDLRRMLAGLNAAGPPDVATGECSPPIDVIETAAAVEVILDVPGVGATENEIMFARNTLIVAGRKRAGPCPDAARAEHGGSGEVVFHVAERTFGRFTRAVQLTGAFDAGSAQATLAAGELHIMLPRRDERRGQDIRIQIRAV